MTAHAPHAETRGTAAEYAWHDQLVTGEAVALNLRPTSFVLRAAGSIIDLLVYAIFTVLCLLGSFRVLMEFPVGPASGPITATVVLVMCLVVVPALIEFFSQGRSLGRLAVGARIVRDDGGAVGMRQAFIRSTVGVLEIFLTLGGFAAITGLLNPRSKRLGDFLAGTYSQHERISSQPAPLFRVPEQLSGWALTADVAKMPDGLARRVTQFLRTSARYSPASRQRLGAELAAEVSAWVFPVPEVPPEVLLTAVAAVRREREFAALMLERERLATLGPALSALPPGFPDR